MSYISEILQMLNQFPWLFITYVTILGLLVGSFLNVVIYRLPIMMENSFKDEYEEYFHPENQKTERKTFNLVVPRSACPNCGHMISAWENIPIISYIFLGGKCKGCKTKISLRYPVVELLTGVLSFFVAYHFGPTVQMVGALLLTWALIAISGIDFDKMLIPDEIVYPMLWLGVLLNIDHVFVKSVEESIYGAVFGYLSLWGFYWVFKLLTKKEGMGYGDFKLVACLGAFLGYKMLPLIIIGSAFLGAIVGVLIIIFSKDHQSKPIPFGPYIAVMGYVAMFFGHDLNAFYLRMILN